MKVFDGNYLFSTPVYAPSVYFAVLTGSFVVLLLASIFVNWRRAKLVPDNPVLRRFVRRVARAGIWIACFGLFFALMRYGGIDYLAPPIWMYLVILAGIATVGYFVYDWSERYPMAVYRLQRSHEARRYRPAARPKAEPQRVRPSHQRGKRRR